MNEDAIADGGVGGAADDGGVLSAFMPVLLA